MAKDHRATTPADDCRHRIRKINQNARHSGQKGGQKIKQPTATAGKTITDRRRPPNCRHRTRRNQSKCPPQRAKGGQKIKQPKATAEKTAAD